MMGKFCMTPPWNPVASCLLTALQHRERLGEVGGFGSGPEIKTPEADGHRNVWEVLPQSSYSFCFQESVKMVKNKANKHNTKNWSKNPSKYPYFVVYNVLPCIMSTHVFGRPDFQGEKTFV